MLETYADVLAALKALPPPSPGTIRVYRGQTEPYPTLTPTALRDPGVSDFRLWHLYQTFIVDRVRKRTNTTSIEEWMFWINALVQHYGPGTEFLDVTLSIDIAIWFALHKSRRAPMRVVLGAGEQLDPTNDIEVEFNAYAYDPHVKTGYLYVLDVPQYNPTGPLTHGMLLDLAAAPKPFSDSARVRAQKACLLAVSGQTDFMPLVVGKKPLEISKNLKSAPSLNWPTEAIYPTPSADTWYRDLLALPIVPRAGTALAFTHPLRMPVYVPTDQRHVAEYAEHIVAYPPLLYFPWLLSTRYGPASEWLKRRSLKNATRILLEGPLLRSMPEPDSHHWNDELLTSVPIETVPFDPTTNAATPPVSLRNVFFEFSALETDWSQAMTPPGYDVIRAAWMTIDAGQVELWIFSHNPLTARHRVVGAFPIYYDGEARELRFGSRRKGGASLNTLPGTAKIARACLTLLRHLAAQPMVSPYPAMIIDDDRVSVPVLKNVCRLFGGKNLLGYYIAMSDVKNPYMGFVGITEENVAGIIHLDVPHGFRFVSSSEL